jgi:hypothetical protein
MAAAPRVKGNQASGMATSPQAKAYNQDQN